MTQNDTILLVEDEEILRRVLKMALERDNFNVYEATLGTRTLEIVRQHRVDLILLDLRLPDASGLELIPLLREHTDAPLLIISGEKNKAKAVSGFYLGADDYILKPFDIDELLARVMANLRRYRGSLTRGNADGSDLVSCARFGPWTLDRRRAQIFREDAMPGDLTAQEFQLLDLLVSHAGRALKRQELGEAIRVDNYTPTPRAIDLKIMRIRKKIGDDALNPQLIKTVRGVGYLFDKDALHPAE